uniref:Transcription factor TFIIIB component B'' Myb domain-containing protein n=1 Tax=Xiphophorus couchianus TaxID=32473 RepID=A0A3B5KTS8_9TELE
MFRRSRFSVRPNVGTVGRTAAGTPQETPAASQETSQTQKEPNESNNASLASNSDVTPSEKAPTLALSFTLNSQTNSSNICLAMAMTRTGKAPAPRHQSRDGSASPSSPRWLLDGLWPSPGHQNPPSKQSPQTVSSGLFIFSEYILDPTKMTMRDLIHYLPESNPMSLEEHHEETETMIPPSPRREECEEEEDAAAEEDQEESVMVPQLKVAEDGSLIIDEESLTVEVQRAKGPNPASDRDPIFERGSTTTYASFRKSNYSKPWSIEGSTDTDCCLNFFCMAVMCFTSFLTYLCCVWFSSETDMFYLAVSMVGTDFSMICQLFPHRARSEIKVGLLTTCNMCIYKT